MRIGADSGDQIVFEKTPAENPPVLTASWVASRDGLRHRGPHTILERTLMSRFVNLAAIAALFTASSSLCAQTQAPPIRMAASSFASVEVHINSRPIGNRWYAEDAGLSAPSRIAITYGQ